MISDTTVADFIASPRPVVEATHTAIEIAIAHRQVKALEVIAGLLERMVAANPAMSLAGVIAEREQVVVVGPDEGSK